MSLLLSTWVKFFFLFAPFFVVSMFLSLTRGETPAARGKIANRAVMAAFLTSLVLFFFGTPLFEVLGITLDSFRIGAGILLFLSAISLVREGVRVHAEVPAEQRDDVSVVPLAIPTIIGPATIGTILVYGAELSGLDMALGLTGMVLALACLLVLLHLASRLEKLLGNTGFNILSKITGLILAAMATEIVISGLLGVVARVS
ncbi:MarC family protein [Marinobacterium arenosum]|uniref:MarC family protein n=1 Tax=Marinobacterium arenosum TaxID=2862496 RepID=UPI001C944917|nr:MarC family protein [Marinobacterium arenosum]MBY4675871.1 MarC family protein [Marinobacterium arenosum]